MENSKQIFPGKELRGYSPNPYIHVTVSDLYISLIGLPILLQKNRWAKRGNITVAPSRVIYLHLKKDVTIFTVLKRLLEK
jgi:hypothetical protein